MVKVKDKSKMQNVVKVQLKGEVKQTVIKVKVKDKSKKQHVIKVKVKIKVKSQT